jgi:hypothetical protein
MVTTVTRTNETLGFERRSSPSSRPYPHVQHAEPHTRPGWQSKPNRGSNTRRSETSFRRHRHHFTAALLRRRLPVPRLDTRPPPQRIRGGIERCEARHLLRQPRVSRQQIGPGLPCVSSAAIRCTWTRVPRNTGSLPTMSASVTPKSRARGSNRIESASSRRGPRRSIFRNPPSSDSVSRGAFARALNTPRRKPGTKRSANRRSSASEINPRQ